MRRQMEWFQNHSLRFKMVVLLFLVTAVLQVLNGFVFTSIVSKKFEENISQANLSTVKQMSVNMNQAMKNIVSGMVPIRDIIFSDQFSADKEDMNEYISRNIRYQEAFYQLLAADDNYRFIHSMLVLDKHGLENYYYTWDRHLILNSDPLFQKIQNDYKLAKDCSWSEVTKAEYFFKQEEGEFISILMPVFRYHEAEHLLIVNIKADAIREYLRELGDVDTTLMLQINESDLIFANPEQERKYDKEERAQLSRFEDWEKVETVGRNVIASSSLSINSWKLSLIVPESSISSNAGVLTRYIVVIILTTGVILLLSVSYIVFIVTKPIKKMTRIMEANRHTRQITNRFYAKYQDEVGVLATTYNQLMDEIQQLMTDIEREQIQRRRTYQRMLQMQIKPHFLYNTLEAAKFLVEMGNPKGVEMLSVIGKFYKLSLGGIDDYTTVREEIEHLKCYLQILKLRYSSKYDYTVDVEEEILDYELSLIHI